VQPYCLILLDIIVFGGKAKEREGRELEKRVRAMTLFSRVGSSTSDPTYLPDDRVTLSRFLLSCGHELGVSSV
jgi:hypothetical protein